MSFIDDLTRDEKELVISLPYRVGTWMSECDDSGGDESDEQEKKVLESILDGYARDVFGSEITQHVMTETVTHKANWEEWAQKGFDRITQDCEEVIRILSRYDDGKDVQAFSHHLIEIAEAVAMAFSEYEEISFFEKIKMKSAYKKEAQKAAKRGERYKSLHEFLSISSKEREVLKQLAGALGVEYS